MGTKSTGWYQAFISSLPDFYLTYYSIDSMRHLIKTGLTSEHTHITTSTHPSFNLPITPFVLAIHSNCHKSSTEYRFWPYFESLLSVSVIVVLLVCILTSITALTSLAAESMRLFFQVITSHSYNYENTESIAWYFLFCLEIISWIFVFLLFVFYKHKAYRHSSLFGQISTLSTNSESSTQ